METRQFIRKPFTIDAVRVTSDNFMQVALWCGGEIRTNAKGESYIKVWVNRPASERQTMAFIGDWVLHAGSGYKVYTDGPFRKRFDPKPEEDACGSTEFTADHKPCVLGSGHMNLPIKIGCRSLSDYKLYTKTTSFQDLSIDYYGAEHTSVRNVSTEYPL